MFLKAPRYTKIALALMMLVVFESCGRQGVDPLAKAKQFEQQAMQHITDPAKKEEFRRNALKEYSKALETGGLSATDREAAYLARGYIYLSQEKCELAIRDFLEAIKLNSRNATATYLLGECYAQVGDAAAALNAYSRAVDMNPELPSLFVQRGLLYMKLGRHSEAIEDFSEAIRRTEPNPTTDSYELRGDAYASAGQLDKAIADYMQEIEIERKNQTSLGLQNQPGIEIPAIAELYVKIGKIYEQRKMSNLAESAYKEALKASSLSRDAREGLARTKK